MEQAEESGSTDRSVAGLYSVDSGLLFGLEPERLSERGRGLGGCFRHRLTVMPRNGAYKVGADR